MADDRAVTYDLTTAAGKVRLLVTDTRGEIFSDDEVDVATAATADVYGAAVYLLRILLVDAARRSRAFSQSGDGGSMSYNDTAAIAGIEAAIRQYERAGSAAPLVTINMPAPLPMDEAWDDNDP